MSRSALPSKISPCSPAGSSRPPSATILTVPFSGMPQVPGLAGPGGGEFDEICAASLEP